MIPDTDSDSATSAERSASRRCCSVVILPAHLSDPACQPHEQRHEHERDHASRQSRMHIATIAAITVVAFWAIVVAVVVTTLSSPPMSLAIRD